MRGRGVPGRCAQDKAGNDEALGLVGLLGQVGVVGAHGSGGSGVAQRTGAETLG